MASTEKPKHPAEVTAMEAARLNLHSKKPTKLRAAVIALKNLVAALATKIKEGIKWLKAKIQK